MVERRIGLLFASFVLLFAVAVARTVRPRRPAPRRCAPPPPRTAARSSQREGRCAVRPSPTYGGETPPAAVPPPGDPPPADAVLGAALGELGAAVSATGGAGGSVV